MQRHEHRTPPGSAGTGEAAGLTRRIAAGLAALLLGLWTLGLPWHHHAGDEAGHGAVCGSAAVGCGATDCGTGGEDQPSNTDDSSPAAPSHSASATCWVCHLKTTVFTFCAPCLTELRVAVGLPTPAQPPQAPVLCPRRRAQAARAPPPPAGA